MPRGIGRTKGRLNSKLHMVSDGKGRFATIPHSPAQTSNVEDALVLLPEMPPAKRLFGGAG